VTGQRGVTRSSLRARNTGIMGSQAVMRNSVAVASFFVTDLRDWFTRAVGVVTVGSALSTRHALQRLAGVVPLAHDVQKPEGDSLALRCRRAFINRWFSSWGNWLHSGPHPAAPTCDGRPRSSGKTVPATPDAKDREKSTDIVGRRTSRPCAYLFEV